MEPQRSHIALAESLVFSEKPSASARFPGGVCIGRCYDALQLVQETALPESMPIRLNEDFVWGQYRVSCRPAEQILQTEHIFTLAVQEPMLLRQRQSGDEIRLSGGTKSLKKLFIDRKIPAADRPYVPVLADALGVLGVPGIGANVERMAKTLPAVQFIFEKEEALGGF